MTATINAAVGRLSKREKQQFLRDMIVAGGEDIPLGADEPALLKSGMKLLSRLKKQSDHRENNPLLPGAGIEPAYLSLYDDDYSETETELLADKLIPRIGADKPDVPLVDPEDQKAVRLLVQKIGAQPS